jgi:Family of unknown function (DUF6350)
MSSLAERPRVPARPLGDPPPSPLGEPALAAVRAAVGGLVPVAVPVVLAWVLGAGGQATWAQAVRLSLSLWLLSQHAGLVIEHGHVGLVPLGLVLVPLTSTWLAGRRLARTMDPRAEKIAAGVTRAAPMMLSGRCLATFAAAYCLVAALASMAAGMSGLRPISAQAVVGAGVIAVLGGGFGAASYRFGTPRGLLRAVFRRTPSPLAPCLRPAATAVAVHLGAGAAVVAVLLITHLSGVTALHRALEPGTVGGAVLTLGEVLLLPNLVVWSSAVLAGPGFALGTGTSVTLTSSHLGPLPAIPLLAALPAPGSMPGIALALLAVPMLSGVAAGAVVVRRTPGAPLPARLGRAGGSAVVAGVSFGVLAWLSGGPAGPGRLAEVGPHPLLAGAAMGVEVLIGAVVTVLAVIGVPAIMGPLRAGMLRVARAGEEAPADDARTPPGTAADPDA